MSLRRRLALLSAAAVALTVVLASAIIYVLVRDSLRDQVDDDLRAQAEMSAGRLQGVFTEAVEPGQPVPARALGGLAARAELPPPPPEGAVGAPGGPPALGQIIGASGEVIPTPGTRFEIPVSNQAHELAAAGGEPRIEDADADGIPLRVLTVPLADGAALQLAASLQNTEDTLSNLVLILFLVCAGGVALAAALGPVVARTALAPAGEVSTAAEEVAATHDLTRRIEVRGEDELGRLAASFNEMMEALERSEAAQRRLVADASHELRTPLATLRTNIETLGRGDELAPGERDRLVEDLTEELEEMTGLVSDVVELAREPGANQVAPQDVRLDELAHDAVERARRRARGLEFRESPRAVPGSGRPRQDRPRDQQPARQRRQVEPGRWRRRGRGRRRPGAGPRSRARVRTRRPAQGVRPLLAVGRGPRHDRVGTGAGDRPPGGRGARRHRQRRERGGRRGRGGDRVASRAFLDKSQRTLRLAWLHAPHAPHKQPSINERSDA